ncbi:MAG TPA: tRNA epoxyqueuosine(34) reductase QueG [Ktedonobacterales bacterium]|nr:tRNA epoxyqueuosine(34) reductase QueG [Ktedonobacterales bacterium]
MDSPETLTERIRERAYALGFDLVRVTSAEPLPRAEESLKTRIAAGFFEGMDWLTAERAEVSSDPTALLPSARSVVALGVFYLTDAPRDLSTPGEPHGRVSAYAWGDDYHEVIRRKLDTLAAFVRELAPPGDEKSIVFCDTGRMVDRAVAERAGLGWYGKNTNILTKGWGSWVFLAELVTGLDLAPDAPLAANCGQCEVCLHACPTNAFVAPYVLDARRCISYLTIEHRGAIPLELRPLIGAHIFGCDICQQVCPVNLVAERRLRASGRLGAGDRLEFRPRPLVGSSPELIPLLKLDDAGFRQRFSHSPIKRTKRRGLLRNVCVALGNIGDPVAIPALIEALSDVEPLVRGHAAWALGRLGGPEARAALTHTLAHDPEPSVQAEARYALETIER